MNVLNILAQLGALPEQTRQKMLQLLGLVAELSADPQVRALIEALTPKP